MMTRPETTLLPAACLRRTTDAAALGIDSTDDLTALPLLFGQERALAAIDFGVCMGGDGYNLFLLGPGGIGKRRLARRVLGARAAAEPTPGDWVYVHNYSEPLKPCALGLAPGQGPAFRDAIKALVGELADLLPDLYEGEDCRARRQALKAEFVARDEERVKSLRERARTQDVALTQTPDGFSLVPLAGGEPMPDEAYEALAEPERTAVDAAMAEVRSALEDLLDTAPLEQRAYRERQRELRQTLMRREVEPRLAALRTDYASLPAVLAHFEALAADLIEHVDDFLPSDDEDDERPPARELKRYRVNVVVARTPGAGAPVVYEDHPLHQNLLGRLEYAAESGNLITDFTLIRAGSLHAANGGYLILEARQLLAQPFAWEGLKRALLSRAIRIVSPGELYGQVTTVSLDPEPITLATKVLLLGDAEVYELLSQLDPDFPALFKVVADLEPDVSRDAASERLYARLIATIVGEAGLRPFAADAIARVIDEAARLAEDAERLSLHLAALSDLLREADFVAAETGTGTVTAAQVAEALARRKRRRGGIEERILEAIRRGTVLIDTQGAAVGQVNGLAVLDLGEVRFAKPVRLSATVRLGSGEVVDIERESELGGAIHAKGVLILTSLLGARYLADHPLSFRASLVFEQSYGPVDGDSASVAECCALLSALAKLPLAQHYAITGSLNQYGRVQAIGGVNEKIEGFWAVCRDAGLTGTQGVIVPAANVQHLMLDPEVVAAVADGRFHIHAVADLDEALALLTGVPAGVRDAQGRFPPDSVNGRVEARLEAFAQAAHRAGHRD